MQTKILSYVIVAAHVSSFVAAAPAFRALGGFSGLFGNYTGDSESHPAFPSGLASIVAELIGQHDHGSGSLSAPSSTSFATASNISATASINDDLEDDVGFDGFGKLGAGHTHSDGDFSGEITSALGDITGQLTDDCSSTLGASGFSSDLDSITGSLERLSDISTATDSMTETFSTISFTPSVTTFFTPTFTASSVDVSISVTVGEDSASSMPSSE
ncbi:hypothetical protein GGU11DRAFT_142591 [Lentinula aff. detonsa]|nr:hypothetical protein GGU11DRAFT_142591 [Lentinula aff. detonsa]